MLLVFRDSFVTCKTKETKIKYLLYLRAQEISSGPAVPDQVNWCAGQ